MTLKNYTARYYGHIESLDYRDGEGQLWLQCYDPGNPHLCCEDTVRLPFSRRERILVNWCDYFDTAANPGVIIVDEGDKDRKYLEDLVERLLKEGHKLTVEYTSAEKQESFEDSMYLKWLKAGKKLVLDGVELATETDYWQWKPKAQPGATPNGGPRWWLAIRGLWRGRHR